MAPAWPRAALMALVVLIAAATECAAALEPVRMGITRKPTPDKARRRTVSR